MKGKSKIQLALWALFTVFLISVFSVFGLTDNNAFAIDYPFYDDMEDPQSGNWIADPPWDYTEESYHSETHSITDSPGETYSNNVNISLTISSGIDLSSAIMPVLTFWHRYSFEANKDYGYVDVSTDSGNTWKTIYFVTGFQTEWKQEKIDLTEYANLTDVRIRFRLKSDGQTNYDGWYIDDVCIGETTCTIAYPFFDDMESGEDNWFSSSWELVSPGHSPTNCWTDSPEGDVPMYSYINSSLILCSTIDLSNATCPQLNFWHHYNGRDFYVEVSDYYGQAGTWKTLATYSGTQANWVQGQVDLSDYVGLSNVRIRFRSYEYYGDGWYIDDVRIEDSYPCPSQMYEPTDVTMHSAHLCWEEYTGGPLALEAGSPFPLFAGFDRYEIYRGKTSDVDRYNGELVCTEYNQSITCCDDTCDDPPYIILEPEYYYYCMYVVDTNGMYSVRSNAEKAEYTIPKVTYPFCDDMESGESNWEWACPWGLTTKFAHSGSYSWTDSPGTSYKSNVNTALETSIDLSSAIMPVLTFWHRYSFEANKDYGYVDVSTDSGNTWKTIYFVTGFQTEWKQEKIDLTEYANLTDVRIRFRLKSDGQTNYDGWYIDDVCIGETTCTIAYPFFDDMESGEDNWFSSSWELVSPGHSPTNCWTDSPEGDVPMYSYINSSLILCSTIDLSNATCPQLNFWHHYNGRDFYVEVSDYYGQAGTWKTLATYSGTQANWVQGQVDLSDYVGLSNVRIRFRSYEYYGDGWYIDDVHIVECCEGDFDHDGDVDGSDLAVFAADFGRTDCSPADPCEGDFDHDGDVDGSDLAVFAADFGRTDCPPCP